MELPKGMSSDSAIKQAQQIWEMLDDMADSSPESYKAFINKQLKEGAEVMKPPKPHMCIQTIILGDPRNHRIYINCFGWTRIPEPKSDTDSISMLTGQTFHQKDDADQYKVVSVAMHPRVLFDYGMDCPSKDGQDMLVSLILDCIETQHHIQLSRHYIILERNKLYMGSLQQITDDLMGKVTGDTSSKSRDQDKSDCADSLLHQLSNLTTKDHLDRASDCQDIKLPSEPVRDKPGLIEEVSSTEFTLPEPTHRMVTKQEPDSDTKTMVLKVELPHIQSLQNIELRISEDDVYILVPEKYELLKQLPHRVNRSETKARFNTTNSMLTVHLPVDTYHDQSNVAD